ncbi:sulfite exporter TauE/SafE family protein [Desulfogranum marinum]|uniref:sulfite exporter TauE/SafE family protein n=1 Tax=Desulfogranum marinum TaxID=453220 RepID=UPI00196360CE|nr:sulfite exporter TauE/SafE family protein [Desulfogranum marinum]MBM9515269.1 sulfite exporter TauE/SafE family protein [Desulfogranum marinum]
MFFPVSGVEVNPCTPFIVAFIVSFFTSMGGVSGAFLLLPFQVSVLGYTTPSVSSTNQLYNIIATPSGVYRYIKEKRMLWPLTWAVIIGTLPGVFIGAWVRIKYLPDPKNFKLFVGTVLCYIGCQLFLDITKKKVPKKGSNPLQAARDESTIRMVTSNIKQVVFTFGGQTHTFSTLAVYAVCFLVGVVGGIYGIGGGAIVAPFFVVIIGLPVHVVAGAALMGTFITSVAGVAFYQYFSLIYSDGAVAPDWALGLLFGCGGFCGMYLGARVQKFVSGRAIKSILCGCVLFVSAKYIGGYFL